MTSESTQEVDAVQECVKCGSTDGVQSLRTFDNGHRVRGEVCYPCAEKIAYPEPDVPDSEVAPSKRKRKNKDVE